MSCMSNCTTVSSQTDAPPYFLHLQYHHPLQALKNRACFTPAKNPMLGYLIIVTTVELFQLYIILFHVSTSLASHPTAVHVYGTTCTFTSAHHMVYTHIHASTHIPTAFPTHLPHSALHTSTTTSIDYVGIETSIKWCLCHCGLSS